MIIVCEQCHTRFHLDDARMPARGARVRCSRCKHAFHVRPPGAASGDLADALAAEAAEAGGAPALEPTRDLDETGGATELAPGAAGTAAGGEGPAPEAGLEEDWQFNEDPRPADVPPRPEAPRPEPWTAEASPELGSAEPARESPPEREEGDPDEEDPLQALGNPENWDLLGAEGLDAPEAEPDSEAEPAAAGDWLSSPGEGASSDEGEAARAEPAAPEAPAEEAAPHRAGGAGRGEALVRTAAHAAAWLAIAALVGFALSGVALTPVGRDAAAPVLRAGGWHSSSARAVRLENARAGELLLVTGRFERAASEPAAPSGPLAVQLVDAKGRPLAGARAPLGWALPERRLRLDAPAALRAALAQRAPGPEAALAGGALPLQAVFASVPAEAAGFVLVAGEGAEGGA